jgi:hypothetical protein
MNGLPQDPLKPALGQGSSSLETPKSPFSRPHRRPPGGVEGSDAYYAAGPRVRKIAAKSGISLEKSESAKEAETATA